MASNPGYHLFYFTSSYCWQSERTKRPWIATFGAWVLAQNGACVYTLRTQYVSVYIIYSLSPCQTPFWNASLAGSAEQWIVLELATMMRTQGPGAHFSSARVRKRLLLLAYEVFGSTLAPLPEFRRAQWVPYWSTVPGHPVCTLPKSLLEYFGFICGARGHGKGEKCHASF